MRISFKKKAPITAKKPMPSKPVTKKPVAKKPVVKKPTPAPTPKITGERIEKKITPGGMYKIKNKYGADGSMISSDTGRTMKGIFRGAIRKGKTSRT